MARNDDTGREKAPKPTPRKVDRAGNEREVAPGDDALREGASEGSEPSRAKSGEADAPAGSSHEAARPARSGSDEPEQSPAHAGAHARHDVGALDGRHQGRMVPAGTGKEGAAPKRVDLPGKNRKRNRAIGVAAAVAAVVLVACIGVFGALGGASSESGGLRVDGTAMEVNDLADDGKLVNPIDWEEWMARNPDVYAWLAVPDTNVDLPILQHPLIDDYYLTHDIDGNPLIDGALYTQLSYNSKDLTEDKVTVVYGHTFEDNDTMFSTLHNFEDVAFFEEHPTFYVYTPTERLEYEVVSAFDYDNRHILETQDMSDPAVAAEFFAMVQNPATMNGNVRALEKALVADGNHLLVLSTCTKPANDSQRFLLVSVLRDVQPTQDKTVDWDDPNLQIETVTGDEPASAKAE